MNVLFLAWQECFDESTGYPYYWHTNTNQVTWEMPPEYRLWKEKKQMTVNQHNLHVSHWPSVSSNSEIPEGMIPKEVVARNRNRQAGIQENRVPVNTKQLDTSLPPHLREDDSDDGYCYLKIFYLPPNFLLISLLTIFH